MVCVPKNDGNKICSAVTLHEFWDDALGTGSSTSNTVKAGKSLQSVDLTLAAKMDTAVWVEESFQMAKTNVYKKPVGPGKGTFPLTLAYRKTTGTLARQRAALVGARLANILNSELK